jgi:hypothetical protein
MALQGLAVVPLFAGFDTAAGVGRLFSYDVTATSSEIARNASKWTNTARSVADLGHGRGLPS